MPKKNHNKELAGLIAEAESDKLKELKRTNERLLKQIDKYGYKYCANEVIGTFKLGGVSTFPTWRNVLVAVKRESFKTKFKYIMRFTLRLVLRDEGYVKFMMKYNRYKAVDASGA